MHKARKAIIMAAGFGSRLQPLTLTTPKPLIKVNGVAMIESVITNLLENDVTEIYTVVGYLKEKFTYLSEKYPQVSLITNPYFDQANNISSLYVARQTLDDNVIILDGDQIIHNSDILGLEFDQSGYLCSYVADSDEWVLKLDDENQVVTCQRDGGHDGWRLYSVSYWTQADAQKLAQRVSAEFDAGNLDVYWDDVAMFLHADEFKLRGFKIATTSLQEIDNLDELVQADAYYESVIADEK